MEPRKRILIVEDDEAIRILIRLYIVRLPFTIYEAVDGLDGLAVANQIVPDLIITDLAMPRMGGLELIKAIRANKKLELIPIIVITGTEHAEQISAIAAGASTVIQKPIKHSVLRQNINVFLPLAK